MSGDSINQGRKIDSIQQRGFTYLILDQGLGFGVSVDFLEFRHVESRSSEVFWFGGTNRAIDDRTLGGLQQLAGVSCHRPPTGDIITPQVLGGGFAA